MNLQGISNTDFGIILNGPTDGEIGSPSVNQCYIVLTLGEPCTVVEINQLNYQTQYSGTYDITTGYYEAGKFSPLENKYREEDPTYGDIRSIILSDDQNNPNAAYLEEVQSPTPPPTPQTYTVSCNVAPKYSATIAGTGTYNEGDTCTITLVSYDNVGFIFKEWTLNGETVSSDMSYSFQVTASVTFVPIFEKVEIPQVTKYSVKVSANSAYGKVEGTGEYEEGTDVVITADPNFGYKFVEWKENGNQISTSPSYTIQQIDRNHEIIGFFSKRPIELGSSEELNYTINVNYRGNQLKFKWSPQIYSYTFADND